MCGLVGIVSPNQDKTLENSILLESMRRKIAHRGPDGYGSHCSGGVFLAHNRLSIIDIEHGHQPMVSNDQRYSIVFNGEIYNFKDIRRDLIEQGAPIRTNSDTETLLYGYIHWGPDILSRLDGMFAFAIWDKKEQSLFLARDRMGVKPLYWSKVNDEIFFASEMKALLVVDKVEKNINYEAISSYLTFRQAVGDISFFKSINKVMPGTFMIYKNGSITTRTYYNLPNPKILKNKSEIFYIEKAHELLKNSVKSRMLSDVPVGAYLSGGLDSSLMVALMSNFSKETINTYSIGYEQEGYDESEYAKIVSDYYGTRHDNYYLGASDHFENLIETIRIKDQPLSIPHEVALHQLSLKISKDIKVVLSGEGADELFGGYGRVQRSPMDWKKIQVLKYFLPGKTQKKYMIKGQNGRDTPLSEINNHMQHFFHVYNWMPFDEKRRIFSGDFNKLVDNDLSLIGKFEKIFENLKHSNAYDRVLYVFEKIHLGCLLERLDMMSMAASLEARVPFVDDHKLVEFVMSIPHHYKLRWKSRLSKVRSIFYQSSKVSEWLDHNKYILRKIGSNYLPDSIAFRKKLGFPTPLDAWFNAGFIAHAKEILLEPRSQERGIYDNAVVSSFLDTKQDISYDFYGKKIWMMLNVELWLRMVEDEY